MMPVAEKKITPNPKILTLIFISLHFHKIVCLILLDFDGVNWYNDGKMVSSRCDTYIFLLQITKLNIFVDAFFFSKCDYL